MIGFRIEVETKQIKDLKGRSLRARQHSEENLKKILRKHALRLKNTAVSLAPGMSKKTHFRLVGNAIKLWAEDPPGRYIIYGTKPHIIRAKGNVLAFKWSGGPPTKSGGDMHFYKQVMHPGTKANPYLNKAYEIWLPGITSELGRSTAKIWKDNLNAK